MESKFNGDRWNCVVGALHEAWLLVDTKLGGSIPQSTLLQYLHVEPAYVDEVTIEALRKLRERLDAWLGPPTVVPYEIGRRII